MAKHKLKAQLLHMAKSEVLAMIPPDTLARIKQTDKKPQFRTYVVSHEGKATPTVGGPGEGFTTKTLRYMKEVVMGVANTLAFGTPAFHTHNGAGTNSSREQIGELVGKSLKTIGNKLSTVATIYLYPQYKKKNLDVASIEAMVEYEKNGDVVNVEEISGIALGNSQNEKPAFAGATLQSVVYSFSKGDNEMALTKDEIKAAIQEGKFKPSDFYDKPDLLADPSISAEIKAKEDHAKRVEKSLGEEREKIVDLTKEKETLTNKVKELNTQTTINKVTDLFKDAATSRKYTAKQKAYIETKLEEFKSENEGDTLKSDFDKFLDGKQKEFDNIVKLLGVEAEAEEEENEDEEDKGEIPASDDNKSSSSKKDLTDPANNDLIPA